MDKDIETLYKELSLSLTEKRLGILASRLIAAYREKEFRSIRTAAEILLGSDNNTSELSDAALFTRVIKHCHPDRTEVLRKEAETAYKSNDQETLIRLSRVFHLEKAPELQNKRKAPEYHPEPEDWQPEPDFAAYEEDIDYNDYVEEDYESWSDEEEVSFLSAIREELIGNLDFTLSPADLNQLEGELDLSGRELTELRGLEYCRHISVLNLSENNLDRIIEIGALGFLRELYLTDNDISDISPLSGLSNLEILDLSGNDIEDISPLLRLPELKFVDLRRNPLRHHDGIIDRLEKRGIAILL